MIEAESPPLCYQEAQSRGTAKRVATGVIFKRIGEGLLQRQIGSIPGLG